MDLNPKALGDFVSLLLALVAFADFIAPVLACIAALLSIAWSLYRFATRNGSGNKG